MPLHGSSINHQNLGEVEYLACYGQASPLPKKFIVDTTMGEWKEGNIDAHKQPYVQQQPSSKKYDEVYNSTVKAPYWAPLSNSVLGASDWLSSMSDHPKHLLCRIKKHRDLMYNVSIHEALDLPVFEGTSFVGIF